MDVVTIIVAALGPLVGVFVGGWVAHRGQARAWHREDQRYLMDTRRQAYSLFLSAVRAYLAYAQIPNVKISALPPPIGRETPIVILDETGTSVRERLQASHANVKFIAGSSELIENARLLVTAVHLAVAARAEHAAGQIPFDTYRAVWVAEREFINSARVELGLGFVGYDV